MGVSLCAMGCRVRRQPMRPGLEFPDTVLCERCARRWGFVLRRASLLHGVDDLGGQLRAEVAFWWAAGRYAGRAKCRNLTRRRTPEGQND